MIFLYHDEGHSRKQTWADVLLSLMCSAEILSAVLGSLWFPIWCSLFGRDELHHPFTLLRSGQEGLLLIKSVTFLKKEPHSPWDKIEDTRLVCLPAHTSLWGSSFKFSTTDQKVMRPLGL